MKGVWSAWLQRFRRGPQQLATAPTSILLASSREDDAVTLREILAHSRWTLVQACTWTDALAAQAEFSFPIILYDRDLSGLHWHEGVQVMARARRPPAVILLSYVADPYLWDELVQAGGFDVLPRPFRREETLAMIEFAHTHWRTNWPKNRLTPATDSRSS
jgi:DNA-binding response OmpR family regulator